MTNQVIFLIVLIGCLAGVLSGLAGVGGGVVIVPLLGLLLGFTQKESQGTSLALFLLPVGFLGVYNYYKEGNVNFKVTFIMAAGFIVGSYIGSKFALSVDDSVLKKVFGAILILFGIKYLFFSK
jgi:uncharacterized protein